MKTVLTYMNKPIENYDILLEQPFDLASPERSTVPLLAYWHNADARVDELKEIFPEAVVGDVTVGFEFQVRPTRGSGKASHTDVMLHSDATLAFEAKYKEPIYESVSKWLGSPQSENRREVLGGWLDVIGNATECSIAIDSVLDCTYQLIHRAASACQRAGRCAVAYHLFEGSDSKIRTYAREIERLLSVLPERQRLPIYLFVTDILPNPEYVGLQTQWRGAGKPDVSQQVRALLRERGVGTFSRPMLVIL